MTKTMGICKLSTMKQTGNYKHGLRHTRLYCIWANIKTRCFNQNDPHFARWGGKGITMCAEWASDFKVFYDWAISNGYDETLTIDRIDNRKNYEPSNCRWVSIAVQNQNKDSVINITYNGKTQSANAWAEELGLGHDTVRQRFHKGWTPEQCLYGKGGKHD